MTDEELDALEKVAEAVFMPNDWRAKERAVNAWDGDERVEPIFIARDERDAAHAATFDPPTALRLVRELREARADRRQGVFASIGVEGERQYNLAVSGFAGGNHLDDQGDDFPAFLDVAADYLDDESKSQRYVPESALQRERAEVQRLRAAVDAALYRFDNPTGWRRATPVAREMETVLRAALDPAD
jgi:hypothetical protein